MTDIEDLWSDKINAFVDAAFESGIVSRNPSDAEQHVSYRYAIKLAIDESRKHGYDHGYYDGYVAGLDDGEKLDAEEDAYHYNALKITWEALEALLHAEKGFANAVRQDTGTAYPWPALDLAEAQALAALEQSK